MDADKFLDRFLTAAEESSKRLRQALMAMVIGSVLIFAAAWNSQPRNWLESYIRTLQHLRYDARISLKSLQTVNTSDVALEEQRARIADYDAKVRKAESMLIEQQYMQVPLFGVSVHLNDAGLIGGLGLIILTIILRYSIRRQWLTLTLLFREARRLGHLEACYHVAGMAQMLTTVPTVDHPQWTWHRHLPKILLLSPAAAVAFLMWIDWRTRTLVPYEVALQRLVLSAAFLLIIGTLTVSALMLSHRLDGLWQAAAEDLGMLKKHDRVAPEAVERAMPPAKPTE